MIKSLLVIAVARRAILAFIALATLFSFTTVSRGVDLPTTLTSKDGRLQIQVPAGYSEKTPPKPTIKIEAASETSAATVLVLSEGQQQFASLAQYAEIVRDQMTSRLTDAQADAGEKLEIGGHPAIRYEITGISANRQRMAFLVTVVQSETRFNQVSCSCRRTDLAGLREEFAAIAGSLKELPAK